MFAGNDYVLKSNGTDRKRAYSTYVELGYPFSVKGVDLVANVGLSPWDSAEYKNDGGDNGYIYTLNGAQSTISNSDYYTGTDSLDYKGYNSMYAREYGSKTGYWWLASPSSYDSTSVCLVNCYRANLYRSYFSYTYVACPLVSLRSGIPVQVKE